jgi:hypothetical protein
MRDFPTVKNCHLTLLYNVYMHCFFYKYKNKNESVFDLDVSSNFLCSQCSGFFFLFFFVIAGIQILGFVNEYNESGTKGVDVRKAYVMSCR